MKNKKAATKYLVVPPSKEPQTDLLTSETDGVDGGTSYAEFGKVYMLGEKSSGFSAIGPLQNYLKLRQHYVQNKTLFVDENFLPKNIVLSKNVGEVVWKRPFEIIKDAEFIIDGATRFDVDQGLLGDCWFLAAVANITLNQKLFSMVVPQEQSFLQDYAGIFHFRFWQFGRWVDVVIDDMLPTINNQLVYLKSSNPREFWPSLLEKAYAKFYGSYKNIEGGQISEALEDMCGGLSEFYYADQRDIFEIMQTSYQRSSFMGASITSDVMEGRRDDGLVTSHAYSITAIRTVTIGKSNINLIRLRNPWGNSVEWNGNWSDRSKSWDSVPKSIRDHMLRKRNDGEFWMEDKDFQRCFTFVDICHLNPSSFLYSDEDTKHWHVNMFEGSWVPNVTAGGSVKYKVSFPNNPQYRLTLRGDRATVTYNVVIGLMQKSRRSLGELELPLELNIYRVKNNAVELLDRAFFESNQPVFPPVKETTRQLTIRVKLPVGCYCIIPCTEEPNIYSSYLLRIYSEVNANIMENDDEVGYSTDVIHNQSANSNVEVHENSVFRRIAGRRNEIGWYGVQKALNQQFGHKKLFCFMKRKISFSKDTTKNIVALWDANYSGRLDSSEFNQLIKDVSALKTIFKKFDKDNSGKLDGFELRNLLAACGYKVNRQILVIIMLRYGQNGSMNFENFVLCAFKLKTMIDEFHRRKAFDNSDQINVNRKDWLQTTLYS